MKAVLYVSHSKRGAFYYNDASARYRCVFPAEALIAQGQTAHAIHFSQINKVCLTNYKKVVFHRPQFSHKLKRIINRLKKKQIECWVDFDDLLFRPELSETSAAVQSGKMSASLAKKHAQTYQNALKLFTKVQLSTDELAKHIAAIMPKMRINITYNKIPQRWVQQLEAPTNTQSLEDKARTRLQTKIIRYLPGTSHHKHDFAHVEIFLAELLKKNPHYHLNVIGDLEFHHNDFPENQISRTPFQPFEQLPNLIDDSWLIIAPLASNIFNQCKSALKFWESGVFGIPVISSPLPDMERFKNKGLCISDDPLAWKDYILELEDFHTYLTASREAYAAAQQAVIPYSEDKEGKNHRLAYLKLAYQYGPRWPADAVNVTTENFLRVKEEFLEYIKIKSHDEKSIHEIEQLNKEIKNLYERDVPDKTNRSYRKMKKLVRSPKQFFKDSKWFKFY